MRLFCEDTLRSKDCGENRQNCQKIEFSSFLIKVKEELQLDELGKQSILLKRLMSMDKNKNKRSKVLITWRKRIARDV